MHRPGRSPRGIRKRRLGNEGFPALGRRVPKHGQASSSGPAQPGCRRRGDRTLIRSAARRVLNRARRRVGKCYETPSMFPGSEGAFSFLSRRFDDPGPMPFSLYLPRAANTRNCAALSAGFRTESASDSGPAAPRVLSGRTLRAAIVQRSRCRFISTQPIEGRRGFGPSAPRGFARVIHELGITMLATGGGAGRRGPCLSQRSEGQSSSPTPSKSSPAERPTTRICFVPSARGVSAASGRAFISPG